MIVFDITELQTCGSYGTQASEFALHAICAAAETQTTSVVLLFDSNYALPNLPLELSGLRVLPATRKYIGDLQCNWLVMVSPFHVKSTDLITLVRECNPQVKVATFVSDLAPESSAGPSAPRTSLVFQLGMGIVRHSDLVMTSSTGCAEALQTYIGAQGRIIQVGHGVSDQYYRDDATNPRVWAHIKRRVPQLRMGNYILTSYARQDADGLSCLMEGYAMLPSGLRSQYPLVIAGGLSLQVRRKYEDRWSRILARANGEAGEVIFLSYISTREIQALYSGCRAFIYAKRGEHFPLSLAEAIVSKCVIASCRTTSISSMGFPSEALFELSNPTQMAERLRLACADEEFRSLCTVWSDGKRDSFRWQTVRAAFSKAVSVGTPSGPASGNKTTPRIGIIGQISRDGSEIEQYNYAIHSELTYEGALRWYAQDANALSIARPDILPLSNLRRASHHFDKLLYVLSDDPRDAPILAHLQRMPGLMWLHDVVLKKLAFHWANLADSKEPWPYIKTLVEKYTFDPPNNIKSWREFQSLPYSFLRPFVANVPELIVHSEYDKMVALADLGGTSASLAIHVVPCAIPVSGEPKRAFSAHATDVNIGIMCDHDFVSVATDALILFGASRKNVTVYFFAGLNDMEHAQGFARMRRVLETKKINCHYIVLWTEDAYLSSLPVLDVVVQLSTVTTGNEVKRVARAIGGEAAVISNSPAINEMWRTMSLPSGVNASALDIAELLDRAVTASYRRDLRDIKVTELPNYSAGRIGTLLMQLLGCS